MSIVTTYDVFCDGFNCLEWTHGTTTGDKNEARRIAKSYGWSRTRLNEDLCPECTYLMISGRGERELSSDSSH